MGVLQIVPVGPDLTPMMVGVRSFPVSKVILVADAETASHVKEAQKALAPLRLETEVRKLGGDPIMDMLRLVTTLLAEERGKYDDIYIHISSGTPVLNSAALSAAFVNGAKAFGVAHDKAYPLPILRFSYHELISEPKLAVLRALTEAGGSVESLQELSEMSGVDKSLLSYHIRGSKEAKGLEELGLVNIGRGAQGRLNIRITGMGRMMLHGRGVEAEARAAQAKAKAEMRD